MRTAGRWVVMIGLAIALAGCGAKRTGSVGEGVPSARPRPPSGAPENVVLPASDGEGGFRTVNSGIAPVEAVWHLRSALNVAALSCDRKGPFVADYNALLGRHKTALAAAYRAEQARFRSSGAVDRHITQVYNFYAQPPARTGFCAAAADILAKAKQVPARDFQGFAVTSLARLQRPFDDFYRSYAQYRTDLAAWQRGDRPSARIAMAAPAPRADVGEPWRIQLGAYTGNAAARQAWDRIRARLKTVTAFKPRYEAVRGTSLVRVQIGPVPDRDQAIAICAAAAGAGLDCLPIAGR